MKFYVGLHHPGDAQHFPRACVSIRSLKKRRLGLCCPDVLIDSGAFSELSLHGKYRFPVSAYADELRRLHGWGVARISAAVAQDYMCEPWILQKTGLTVEDHQRLTIERYDALIAEKLPVPIMPVLQGFMPDDYIRHIDQYGERLQPGMWMGVGSVCKRNGRPSAIMAVLWAIHVKRPDLRLHGFGLKRTALEDGQIRKMLYSADSMAWSFAARYEGRDRHSWREAKAYADRIMET